MCLICSVVGIFRKCHALPLPHLASIFFAYLWSFRWPNYIVTLPRYFSFRLPHLNIPTGPPQTNWTRIFSERHLVYFSVIETDTATSGLRWIFHMHSEFSRLWTSLGLLFSHWNGYSHFRFGLNWFRKKKNVL
jgi:hypothetical protein